MDALVWDGANLRHLAERWGVRAVAVRAEVDALYDSARSVARDVEYLTSRGEWQW